MERIVLFWALANRDEYYKYWNVLVQASECKNRFLCNTKFHFFLLLTRLASWWLKCISSKLLFDFLRVISYLSIFLALHCWHLSALLNVYILQSEILWITTLAIRCVGVSIRHLIKSDLGDISANDSRTAGVSLRPYAWLSAKDWSPSRNVI